MFGNVRIMEVSEEVLFGTLAQLLQKEYRESQNKNKPSRFRSFQRRTMKFKKWMFNMNWNKNPQLLILYGTKVVNFEDWVLTDEQDQNSYEVQNDYKVFEKFIWIFKKMKLRFQIRNLRELYAELVKHLAQSSDFEIMTFLNSIPPNLAQIVSASLMDEERYTLHNWEGKGIAVIHKRRRGLLGTNNPLFAMAFNQ